MKVLHVIPSVGPARGGPSRAVLDMCRGLTERGVGVTLATTNDNGPDCLEVPLNQPVQGDGYTTWYFPRQFKPYTVSSSLLYWLYRNVDHFDLIHIHAVFSHVSDWASLLIRHRNKLYGLTPHGILREWGMRERHPIAKQLLYRLLVSPNLRRATFVHFTSEQEKQEAEIWDKLPHSTIIPLGLPLPPAKSRLPTTANKSSLTLLFLSRIDPIKGLEDLFHALEVTLKRGDKFRLVVAGTGEPGYVNSLHSLARRLGISEHIDWTGFVSGQQKRELLEAADAFVLPSHSESFGVVVVEAMAAGLPVITTDRVGIYEAVQEAGAGLVVPCAVGALSAALLQLANSAELRHLMSDNGQRLAHNRFSLSAMTTDLIDLYQNALR